MQSCSALVFALDNVGAHGDLAGFEMAGDRRAANHLRAARLEADFLPIAIFYGAGLALAAHGEFVGGCFGCLDEALIWINGTGTVGVTLPIEEIFEPGRA